MPAKKKKSKGKRLDKLAMKKTSTWEGISKTDERKMEYLSEDYKVFLDTGKTEREVAANIMSLAGKEGFKDVTKAKNAKPGDRLCFIHRNKVVGLAVVGTQPLEVGVNIVGSHIDSPRLDLKPNPLYQDRPTDMALLKTHYYGGVKKYNWANVPLAIHGIVITEDGKEINICIGEDPKDPVFIIPDLEPHLYRRTQGTRKLPEGFKGEELRIIVAHRPVNDKKLKDRVKLWVLDHLNKEYGMVEEDFCSAEIEIVPAAKAQDVGLDRSFVGGYGQDDRVCAFTTMRALFELKRPKRTAVALFFDKEEIGSTGATGAESFFMRNFIGLLFEAVKKGASDTAVWTCLMNSYALSADVTGGVNPIFKDVHEMGNAPIAGKGIVFSKYTGSGGKYSASDANPEFIGKVRKLFNVKKVAWQSAELGKVDEGGGGTIAKFLARYGMEVVDCGPGLISIHTPFELTSKVDLYHSYKAYRVFYDLV